MDCMRQMRTFKHVVIPDEFRFKWAELSKFDDLPFTVYTTGSEGNYSSAIINVPFNWEFMVVYLQSPEFADLEASESAKESFKSLVAMLMKEDPDKEFYYYMAVTYDD